MLPDRVRTWAEGHAPQAVVDVTAIGGGITNTKWLVRLAGSDQLVLRWSDPLVWGAIGREHVRREALACRLLAGSALPVPRLVASDVDGASAGGPVNLMSWRPGRARLDRLGPDAITALADWPWRCTGSRCRWSSGPDLLVPRVGRAGGSGLGAVAWPVAAGD